MPASLRPRFLHFLEPVARGVALEDAARAGSAVPWRWMIAIAELPASVRRSSSSVLRLLISCSSAVFSWSTASRPARWRRRSAPSCRSAACVATAGPSSTLDSAASDARRLAQQVLVGLVAQASITPRVIGSELLPAASRFATVIGVAPVTRILQRLQLGLVLFLDHWRQADAGVVCVFVQFSQVRSRSPSTRVAKSAAAWARTRFGRSAGCRRTRAGSTRCP